jgi:hypothetical protein
MQEHALFIKAGLPCENTDLIDEAQAFYQEFEGLKVRADRVQNDKKFLEVVVDTQEAVREFHHFKHLLLGLVLTCKLAGFNYPLFLDHLAREAEYVLRLLDKMKEGKTPLTAATKAQENIFWLRLMGDHIKFISHLLDPSERNLIRTANDFAQEFDDLYLQGRDFASMLQHHSEVAAFKRFVQDVRVAVIRVRDFKKAAHDMIGDCRLVGLIPGLLADHVRREADHFLLILAMMEKGIMKNVPVEETTNMGSSMIEITEERDTSLADISDDDDEEDDDVEDDDEDDDDDDDDDKPPVILSKPSSKVKVYKQEKPSIKKMPLPSPKIEDVATIEVLPKINESIKEEEVVVTAPPIVQTAHHSTKPSKEGHAKMGAKWPRQLGKLLK